VLSRIETRGAYIILLGKPLGERDTLKLRRGLLVSLRWILGRYIVGLKVDGSS
jgi:hypothetical protein